MNIPEYVILTRSGQGHRYVDKGSVFDTKIPNDFSKYTWAEILLEENGVSNWKGYFEEITASEYFTITKKKRTNI